jgi:calcium/calmodulin-dependent protein kinase I
LKTRCGTPAFVAPEVLIGEPYTETVDMWGVGVILYLLIGGYPPFRDDHHRGLFRKIRAGDFVFHEAYWGTVSVEAKQLISSLLTVDPQYRYTAEQALDASWMHMKDQSSILARFVIVVA